MLADDYAVMTSRQFEVLAVGLLSADTRIHHYFTPSEGASSGR